MNCLKCNKNLNDEPCGQDHFNSKEVILLQTIDGSALGIFSSYKELREGVTYFINHLSEVFKKNFTLCYYTFRIDYSVEPTGCGYAYIPSDEFESIKQKDIDSGADPEFFEDGTLVPDKNLINTDYDSDMPLKQGIIPKEAL